MATHIETLIATALTVDHRNDIFFFTCEVKPFVVDLFEVSPDVLAAAHPHLPAAAAYLCDRFSSSAADCIRITLEHWQAPRLATNVGGMDFRSRPRAIEPAPEGLTGYRVTADLYNMMAIPGGVTAAFVRNKAQTSMLSREQLEFAYPGAATKVDHVVAIGGFDAEAIAALVFTDNVNKDVVIDTSNITFDNP